MDSGVCDGAKPAGSARGLDERFQEAETESKEEELEEKCFTADTLIYTSEGYRFIKEIQKGDDIYSRNAETGETGLRKVEAVFRMETHTVCHIWLEGSEEIRATGSHPFYVRDKGWVKASELCLEDEAEIFDGTARIVKIEKEHCEETVVVYNLQVEEWESFFVSEMRVYVHNCGDEDGDNPVFEVSRSKYPNHTELLEDAQEQGHSLKGLQRGGGKREAKRNRYEAQKAMRKQQGGPPAGHDYDEFPYASTRQGGRGACVKPVPSAENQAVGRDLGTFYRENNIQTGDKFDIKIVK